MRKIVITTGLIAALSMPAHADLQFMRWGTNIEQDPFEGNGRLTMGYLDGPGSGIIINCREKSDQATFRVAFPFEKDQVSDAFEGSKVRLKVDDFAEISGRGSVVTLQNGKVGIDTEIYGLNAWQLLENLRDGLSTLYVKVGPADTISVPLRGSTKAAREAIPFCLTEESKAKPAIDWSKEAEKSASSNSGNDTAKSSEQTDERKANAMHHIASVRALANLCSVLEPNDALITILAAGMNIDLSPDSPDFATMDEDMSSQVDEMNELMDEFGEGADLLICTTGMSLYGENGTNVKNLLIPVD